MLCLVSVRAVGKLDDEDDELHLIGGFVRLVSIGAKCFNLRINIYTYLWAPRRICINLRLCAREREEKESERASVCVCVCVLKPALVCVSVSRSISVRKRADVGPARAMCANLNSRSAGQPLKGSPLVSFNLSHNSRAKH